MCDLKAFGGCYYGEFYVVYLDATIIVPNDYVVEVAKKVKKRLMLLPPYREALAQAYGRYFMRVGNPIDIEQIDLLNYPKSI